MVLCLDACLRWDLARIAGANGQFLERPRVRGGFLVSGIEHRAQYEHQRQAVGIDHVEADVLPDSQGGSRECSPAAGSARGPPTLAQAELGIAMATGTDVAIESAGVTLVRGDLRGIVRARRLSHTTMRNIRQDLFFAFIYNVAGVPIAAGHPLSVVRPTAQPDACECGHDLQLKYRSSATP